MKTIMRRLYHPVELSSGMYRLGSSVIIELFYKKSYQIWRDFIFPFYVIVIKLFVNT